MPPIVISIVDWCVPFELKEMIKGDISEGLFNRLTHTKLTAYVWLFRQMIGILWHFSPTNQRGSIMFIFSFLVVSSIVMMTFWLGGPPSMYFNLPSLIIVVIPALLAPFMMQQKSDVFDAFKALVDNNSAINSIEKYIRTFQAIDKVAMMMGWFGVISGAVAMANNIEPEVFPQVFGPAFAVMSLTLLYALIVKVLCHLAVLRLSGMQSTNFVNMD